MIDPTKTTISPVNLTNLTYILESLYKNRAVSESNLRMNLDDLKKSLSIVNTAINSLNGLFATDMGVKTSQELANHLFVAINDLMSKTKK
jgi:hypothetical protein